MGKRVIRLRVDNSSFKRIIDCLVAPFVKTLDEVVEVFECDTRVETLAFVHSAPTIIRH